MAEKQFLSNELDLPTSDNSEAGRRALAADAFQPPASRGPQKPTNFLSSKVDEWVHDYQLKKETDAQWEQWDKEASRKAITLDPNVLRETFAMCRDKMDFDGNGQLTSAEIQANMRECSDASYSALDAMSLYAHDIEEQVDDEIGDENSGISQRDIDRLADEWSTDNSFDLVRRINYLANQDSIGLVRITSEFHKHQFALRESWGRGGSYVGAGLGVIGGGVLTEVSGGALAPTIIIGAMAGSSGGEYVGKKLGGIRADLASPDRFTRSYVDKVLEID